MRVEDLPGVLAIERCSFPTPWSEAAFRHEMFENPDASLFVVTGSETPRIVGYGCIWVVAQELRINNLAIHPVWRGRGIGTRLLRFLLDHAAGQGCREAKLEVRPNNEPALRMYERAGFRTWGRCKNYYADTHEDALVMVCRIEPPGRR